MLNFFKSTKNFRSSVDYDLEYSYSCRESGCYSEGICRCSTITSIEVRPLGLYEYVTIAKKISSGSDLEKALDLLYLIRGINEHSFDVSTCSGYYGEEVASVTLNLPDFWHQWNKLNPLQKTHYLLTQEYGFVLDHLKSLESISLKSLSLKKVAPSLNSNLNRQRIDFYEDYCSHSFDYYPPIIAYADENGYQLVDGRHKHQALKESGKRKANVIVLAE